jgi:Arc/MetJ-type ribon-helix-helix transcriptional regulator
MYQILHGNNLIITSRTVADYVGSKIPCSLKDALEKAVKTGSYLNISDFIRDAIKQKLEREGFWTKSDGVQNNQEF